MPTSGVGLTPVDWSDWVWGALGNAVGGVLAVLVIGLLVELAISLRPRVRAIAEWSGKPRSSRWMRLLGGLLIAAAVFYDWLGIPARLALAPIIVVGLGITNARLVERLLSRVGQTGPPPAAAPLIVTHCQHRGRRRRPILPVFVLTCGWAWRAVQNALRRRSPAGKP